MQLTQKENSLLKDMTDQEKLCSDKYRKNAKAAADPQLAALFDSLATAEDGHLNTLNEIASGSCPQMNSSGGSGGSTGSSGSGAAGASGASGSGAAGGAATSFTAYHTSDTPEKKNDAFLCSDLLSSEKHASHLYDTCIFEFTDECVRQTLNHIQTEEQEHGKRIYDYMKTNGMYS